MRRSPFAVGALACGSDAPTTPTSTLLTPGASASALVSATAGGSITAGDLVLEIPPGALTKDTTITVTQLGTPEQATFALQPSGTTFAIPAIAHYTLPAPVLAKLPVDRPVAGIRWLYDDEGTKADWVATTPDPDATHLRAPVEHFSTLGFDVLAGESMTVSVLTPAPIEATTGEEFGIAANYTRTSDDVVVAWHAGLSEPILGRATMSGVAVNAKATGGTASPNTVVDTAPKPEPNDQWRTTPITPAEELAKKDAAIVKGSVFQCIALGSGRARAWVAFAVQGTLVVPGVRLKRDPDRQGLYEVKSTGGQTTLSLTLDFIAPTPDLEVHCSAKTAMMSSLGLLAGDRAKIPTRRSARTRLSYPTSTGTSAVTPTKGTAIGAAQDPLFTVGPGAAARLTTQFPCGDGPIGKTVCGTAGAFTPGDWVVLVSDFDSAIPLADPTWRYQHAFVFDADGIAANDYVAPAKYPKDFFAGTDKWFQLFYEPGKGWSVKVVDVRISNTNPVPSAARFVIAGRELAIFIPRAELDGAAPTFRVTTFRHQGDYGLSGGPVDLSYYPLLGEPLLPAVVTSAIVLPE